MTPLLEVSSDLPGLSSMAATSSTSSGIDVLPLDHQDRLVDVLVRVGQMRTLGEDWNSYGSAPPSERLIEAVEALLIASDTVFGPFLAPPHPVPIPGGGIKLTWTNGDRELELELGPVEDGLMLAEFLRVSHGEPLSEGPVTGVELVEHLTWVIQG